MKDNIILVGFMGCGKSSVGKRVSYMLKRTLIDTDVWIEQHEKMTIPEIFEKYGEAHFRDLETKCIQELIRTEHNRIISTGGGLPVREENRKLLHELGQVIYLKVSPETVYQRVKHDTGRPLLQTPDPVATICELMDRRKECYEDVADVTLSNDGEQFDEVLSYFEQFR